ncbi:MAG: NifU family protein [Ignavibacteriaceae bacterium]|nr:NifU family protein [Ignavibacterium sp.]MCC6256455.1 NifU family protein [Ignavibacteriaceae bacterium]HMN23718.1 NifU family protein [Ignavibacteriaceae bacterium]HRN27567.1 NifU family protein [Ignavibacteriaceae bacterium]HRP92264.1 NifU family protein [Ignavibacteriaceae bacterium]
MKDEVQKALNNIRPYLQADNGDVELVEVTDDGIVKVRLLGSCKDCPLSVMTLRAGIERAIMREVPSVRRIEAVS